MFESCPTGRPYPSQRIPDDEQGEECFGQYTDSVSPDPTSSPCCLAQRSTDFAMSAALCLAPISDNSVLHIVKRSLRQAYCTCLCIPNSLGLNARCRSTFDLFLRLHCRTFNIWFQARFSLLLPRKLFPPSSERGVQRSPLIPPGEISLASFGTFITFFHDSDICLFSVVSPPRIIPNDPHVCNFDGDLLSQHDSISKSVAGILSTGSL